MKSIKTLALLLALILTLTSTAYAKNTNSGIKKTTAEQSATQPHQIMFDGIIYTLKYSTNQTRSGEYMNEYYKSNEKGSEWTVSTGKYSLSIKTSASCFFLYSFFTPLIT